MTTETKTNVYIKDISKEIASGVISLIRQKSFYGHILVQLPKIYGTTAVPTMGVGINKGEKLVKLYINTDFVQEVYNEAGSIEAGFRKITEVLEHEVLHICHPAGTLVGGSFEPIENLKKGSVIIGSDGLRHKAESFMARDYSGKMFTIKPRGMFEYDVTKDHPILVADVKWKTINTSIPRRNIRIIKDINWKKSQDVKEGDWIVIPRIKGDKNTKYFKLDIKGNHWSLPKPIRDGKLILNEEIAWLMGWYCAEGCSGFPSNKNLIDFSLNKNEKETLGQKAKFIINKYIGCKARIYDIKDTNAARLQFCSYVISRLFVSKIGKGAENKKIPSEILYHKDDRILKAFLRGYFDGDGVCDSKMLSCTTVSKKLSHQVQLAFARFGVLLNGYIDKLSKKKPKVIVSGNPSKMKDQYKLYSQSNEARSVLGLPIYDKKRPTRYWHSNDEFIFTPVKKVKVKDWSGKVYNLQSPTKDYLVHNMVVHNCFSHLELNGLYPDRTRLAVAVDMSVNSYLDKNNLPGKPMLAEDFDLPTKKGWMWYYKNLADNKKYKEMLSKIPTKIRIRLQNGGGGGKKGEPQEGDGKGKGNGKGDVEIVVDSHGLWDEVGDDPILKEAIKDIVRQAKELSNREYGNIHGDIVSMIEEFLQHKASVVPWKKVLRMFIAQSVEGELEYTNKRESKRFGMRPGTRKTERLKLAVAIDTSGSVDDQMAAQFFNEIYHVWKDGNNCEIDVFEADTKIQAEYRYRGKFKGEIHGRGGTDLEPVLKEIEKRGGYDGLIYFTDFYAPHIEKRYRVNVLWVLNTEMSKEEYPYQWGQFVRIESGSAERG